MIRAIIIDDEFRYREELVNLIDEHCNQVEIVATADSTKAGLNAINTHQPDVVFLDIEMPKSNGFELLDVYKKTSNGINFEIIFTPEIYETHDMHVEFAMAVRAQKYGALDYLLKPFDANELMTAVKKVHNKTGIAKKNQLFPENNLMFFDNAKL